MYVEKLKGRSYMIGKIENKKRILVMLVIVFMLIPSREAYAVDSIIPQTENKEERISVTMPTVNENEESPFDFIIDPQGLVYDTNAMLYGGGVVEEGAHLLFHNKNADEYTFSSCSDYLTVTNYSTDPVVITISAEIEGIGSIDLVPDMDFSVEEGCGIYLALVDDRGNEQPLSESEEVSISVEMNEELREYSFGLSGQCDTNAAWQDTSIHPRVKVTWQVESVNSNDEIIEKYAENVSVEEDMDERAEEIEEPEEEKNRDKNSVDKGYLTGDENLEDKENSANEENLEDVVNQNKNSVNDNNEE